MALETREMERLHKIDVAATALDQMVQDYARESERLQHEIDSQRAAWEEETRNAERERREQADELKRQRQREIDDYEYKKNQERKKERDKYEEEQRILARQNKERQETLEREWANREAALSEAEAEGTRLRRDSDAFPAKLQEAVERATREATQAAETRLSQQIAFLERDRESDRKLADLQIKALEATIARQNEQLAALQKQLDEAKVQVQEIAVRAIEGASGANALSHVNQIAIEQAKHRQQT